MKKKKCLFLDRDGVINEDIAYAHLPEHINFVAGIFELCRLFQRQGYLIIIVTNQSGIARDYYSEQDFQQLTQWMIAEFRKRGIAITEVYHCPHHPKITGPCACRKPLPGMLNRAIARYNIDATKSYMIGDKLSDMQAALSAGIKNRIHIDAESSGIKRAFLSTIRVQYHRQLLALLTASSALK